MIKSLELKNIQSHKNTKLEFSPGINAIIGSSNNGKSAILRGLYWVKNNRPLGIDTLNSHWNFDNKSNIKDEMSVTLVNDSSTVTRKRTKNDNQYIVNGKVLNVVKSDVPDDVISALNITDTNVQKQLDAPFLLSESSGEVAKYFNKIVRLDIIDKVLSNAESKRRKTNQDIERTEKEIETLENKLNSFSWMDGVDRIIHKIEVLNEMYDQNDTKIEPLEDSIDNYKSCKTYDFSEQNKIISKIENLNDKLETLEYVEIENLKQSVSNFKKLKTYNFSEQKAIIDKVEKLNGNIESIKIKSSELESQIGKCKCSKTYNMSEQKKLIKEISDINLDNSEIKKLEEQIFEFRKHSASIEKLKYDIAYYKSQLPDVCPYCGQSMESCKDL